MEPNTERYLIQEYSAERAAAQGKVDADQWEHLSCFGLAGETGEVVEMVKKHQFHGKPLASTSFHMELGDVLWYLNFLAHHHPSSHGLYEVANVSYFADFELGFSALRTDPDVLMGMGAAHLITNVGKIVAQLYFKEPWTAGPRELQVHMRGVLWSIAALAHVTGSDLESVARLNNEKLRKRYPNGFSIEAAQAVKSPADNTHGG